MRACINFLSNSLRHLALPRWQMNAEWRLLVILQLFTYKFKLIQLLYTIGMYKVQYKPFGNSRFLAFCMPLGVTSSMPQVPVASLAVRQKEETFPFHTYGIVVNKQLCLYLYQTFKKQTDSCRCRNLEIFLSIPHLFQVETLELC